MPTLPGPNFTEAVNKNGVKQVIPRDWLKPNSPFFGQFRLTARAQAARQEKEAKASSTKTARPAASTKTARPAVTTRKTPPSGDDKKE